MRQGKAGREEAELLRGDGWYFPVFTIEGLVAVPRNPDCSRDGKDGSDPIEGNVVVADVVL